MTTFPPHPWETEPIVAGESTETRILRTYWKRGRMAAILHTRYEFPALSLRESRQKLGRLLAERPEPVR